MQVSNGPTRPININIAQNNRSATFSLPTQDVFIRSLRFAGAELALREERPEPETQDRNPLADVFIRCRDIEALSFLTKSNIQTLKEIKNQINNLLPALQPEIFEGWLQVADALRHVEHSRECIDMSMNLLNKLLNMKQKELKRKNIQKPDSNDAKTFSRIYKSLAKIHQRQGNIETALELMEEAIAVERSHHNLFYYGTILHYDARELAKAKSVYLNALLALDGRRKNEEYVSRCCLCLGDLSIDEGKGLDAIQYYQRSQLAAPNPKLKAKAMAALRKAQDWQSGR